MSILINLLPEARLARLRNQSRKRFYTAIAIVSTGSVAAVVITFLLFLGFLNATYLINESRLNDLNQEISKNKDLEQNAATLQANLQAFTILNQKRTYPTRIYKNLYEATPDNVKITSIQVNVDGKITISGVTKSFADVGRYREILLSYNVNYKPQPGLDRSAIFTSADIKSASPNIATGTVTFALDVTVDQKVLAKQVGK